MHDSWRPFLNSEFEKPYFKELCQFLHQEYQDKQIFPKKSQVFRAFTTDLNKVTVVILGQDPYHTPGAAHGLAFSVPPGQKIPPSLVNIYKEIENDIGVKLEAVKLQEMKSRHTSGCLTSWQNQGVLLLNNTLTVEAHHAGSHRGRGWEIFTEAVIKYLDEVRPHLVFLLWGRDARSKASLVNQEKHLVLESPHPSPLSANYGFFGNHHFSKANQFLKAHDLPEISW